MRTRERVRQVGNLINLSTPLGRVIARVGGADLEAGPRGLIVATGYRPRFPFAWAFTVGNVILTRGAEIDERLLRHEERHSWQWFCCLGLPFLPLYGAAMLWSVVRTGDRAIGNVFERHAGLVDGGYVSDPQTG